jgi:hypothetical protein
LIVSKVGSPTMASTVWCGKLSRILSTDEVALMVGFVFYIGTWPY